MADLTPLRLQRTWTADPRVPALLHRIGAPVPHQRRDGSWEYTGTTTDAKAAVRKLRCIAADWLIAMDGEPDQNERAHAAPQPDDVLEGLERGVWPVAAIEMEQAA